ncbi:MAG TPA: hypothetical protein VH374_01660 [Polyangia bacterium]|jgi:hypothetical protein|nr:hypothetical protein [Polyangia bacterium]
MSRISHVSIALALAGFLGIGFGAGCGTGTDDATTAQREAVMAACHLDDGTVEADADVHACDPHDTKKTTICHIPPGNPANEHTLCVGNPAVPAHIRNHGDYVGPCKHEVACPAPTGSGGASGTGGAGDNNGTGGAPGTGGTPGTGGAIVIP